MRTQRRDASIPSSRRTPEPLAARVFLCVALAPPRCETNACSARQARGTVVPCLSPNVFDMAAMCLSWLSSTIAITFHWPGYSQHISEMLVLVFNVWQGVAVAAPGGSTEL